MRSARSGRRLVLHFSDEDGDISPDVWNELRYVLQSGDWAPRLGQKVDGEHRVHDVARQVVWDALEDFANEAQGARFVREAQLAAEAKAAVQTESLGECDDVDALISRAREIDPTLRVMRKGEEEAA